MVVCTAIMPQPMSTPTAAGMIAPLVGITEPTVAPMPQCTSGMTATCLWMNGSAGDVAQLLHAPPSSIGTPCVHALIGDLAAFEGFVSAPRRLGAAGRCRG